MRTDGQMALTYTLAAMGARFRVLPSAFAVHLRHPPSDAKLHWADNAADRATKRLLWAVLRRTTPLPM